MGLYMTQVRETRVRLEGYVHIAKVLAAIGYRDARTRRSRSR